MRIVATTDLLEVWRMASHESTGPRMMHHALDALDGRGRMLLQLVQAWGAMSVLGDLMDHAMNEAHDFLGNPMSPSTAKAPKETIEAFVMRCSDVVDTVYHEMERRGWMARVPGGVEE